MSCWALVHPAHGVGVVPAAARPGQPDPPRSEEFWHHHEAAPVETREPDINQTRFTLRFQLGLPACPSCSTPLPAEQVDNLPNLARSATPAPAQLICARCQVTVTLRGRAGTPTGALPPSVSFLLGEDPGQLQLPARHVAVAKEEGPRTYCHGDTYLPERVWSTLYPEAPGWRWALLLSVP